MTIVNGYCTLTELAQRMGLDADKVTLHTDLLETAIEDASRYIDLQTDSIFFQQAIANEFVEGYGVSENGFYMTGNLRTIVASAPIISVTTLEESGVVLTQQTAFDGDGDYHVHKSTGLIERNDGHWSGEPFGVKLVSAIIGYAATPKDIREFCLQIATIYSRLDNRIITDGDGTEINVLSTNIPKSLNRDLRRRRKAIV